MTDYLPYIRDLQSKTQNLTSINLSSVLTGELNVSSGVFSPTGSFDSLGANSVVACGVISGPTGLFDSITSTHASFDNLAISNISVSSSTGTNVYASNVSFNNLLVGPTGSFYNLNANTITANTGEIQSLTTYNGYTVRPLYVGTAINPSTSEYDKTITGIPSWATRITLTYYNLKFTVPAGYTGILMRVGTGPTPTIVASGYSGSFSYGTTHAALSTEIALGVGTTNTQNGVIEFILVDRSTYTYVFNGTWSEASVKAGIVSGRIDLSATISAFYIFNLMDNYFASGGYINVMYQ